MPVRLSSNPNAPLLGAVCPLHAYMLQHARDPACMQCRIVWLVPLCMCSMCVCAFQVCLRARVQWCVTNVEWGWQISFRVGTCLTWCVDTVYACMSLPKCTACSSLSNCAWLGAGPLGRPALCALTAVRGCFSLHGDVRVRQPLAEARTLTRIGTFAEPSSTNMATLLFHVHTESCTPAACTM